MIYVEAVNEWRGNQSMKKIFILLICVFISIPLAARNITLSEQQYKTIIDRLEKDKDIMQKNDAKWNDLRKQVPEVEYKVTDGGVVVEKITIPIKDDNPLEYQSDFTVVMKTKTEGFFPLKLRLYGGVEVQPKIGETIEPDVKLAIKLLGFRPLRVPILENFGFNAMAGVRGFGASLSYDLPAPIANTAVHAYFGTSYKWEQRIGMGISLNF